VRLKKKETKTKQGRETMKTKQGRETMKTKQGRIKNE